MSKVLKAGDEIVLRFGHLTWRMPYMAGRRIADVVEYEGVYRTTMYDFVGWSFVEEAFVFEFTDFAHLENAKKRSSRSTAKPKAKKRVRKNAPPQSINSPAPKQPSSLASSVLRLISSTIQTSQTALARPTIARGKHLTSSFSINT